MFDKDHSQRVQSKLVSSWYTSNRNELCETCKEKFTNDPQKNKRNWFFDKHFDFDHLWFNEFGIHKKTWTNLDDKWRNQFIANDEYQTYLRNKHKQYILWLWRTYKGSIVTHKKTRETNCWNCKHIINNKINLECSECGWIICFCGACRSNCGE